MEKYTNTKYRICNKQELVKVLVFKPSPLVDIIISKHKRYLENGGKFILPLPEFKIIQA